MSFLSLASPIDNGNLCEGNNRKGLEMPSDHIWSLALPNIPRDDVSWVKRPRTHLSISRPFLAKQLSSGFATPFTWESSSDLLLHSSKESGSLA